MDKVFSVDWTAILIPEHSVLEMVVRGTLVYLGLFVIMRFLLKRQAGQLGIADLIVVVLIADASQNAMGSEYKSVTEGATLVLTIVAWNTLIDWLGHRYPAFERLFRPPALPLIENGQLNRRNMAAEMISREELMSQLREQGVEDVSEVKRCTLEGDGRVSVIKAG